ncbi:MAG: ATP-binding cassette domain-containing protein [Lachnospiraceae bacterium]|nr:ATP-binding cassette domain-containing protein [Lachnospiraceae bacterium]
MLVELKGFELSEFGYQQDRKVISDFSMQVDEGKCVAIVGESGCGKSTLAKLLLGFYPLETGQITILGKNGTNSTLQELREQIAYVPQEPYLYGVSIAENIAYGIDLADEVVVMY